ncbi:IclR family transcriptional regulator [Umezawaea endophytica]|uniref:Helix-turn-helix domain-containing protein n=1 Tax=Umezawaea endophytica TaxID=1654476 RepID=A0A9X2VPJ9_9PSEU|nr:helix-turn-helix domain-containing protein [Umezawaea endophytica]MCS7480453.1 helix-turn-helix domain-containing protein [Umezawaea endophytica]
MSGTAGEARRSGRPRQGEPLLERAFKILGAFTTSGGSLPLHVLASRAELPKSTTSRIAAQLVGVGALERLENGDFVVGLQMLEIASLAPRGHGLRAAALPFMEDLHRATRQHILLAVLDGHEAVLVERLSALGATAVKYRVGGRLPLDTTGIGIALLAHAAEQVREDVLAKSSRPVHVRQLMAMVRTEGVCAMSGPNPVDDGPATVSTVAAPILGRGSEALGAISLVAPEEVCTKLAPRVALRTSSLAISRALLSAATPGHG